MKDLKPTQQRFFVSAAGGASGAGGGGEVTPMDVATGQADPQLPVDQMEIAEELALSSVRRKRRPFAMLSSSFSLRQ